MKFNVLDFLAHMAKGGRKKYFTEKHGRNVELLIVMQLQFIFEIKL
jgi:hypothetical protein